MSITPEDYLRKAKEMRSQLLDECERIVYANEKEITSMNIKKIESGQGSDGNLLKNSNSKFSGRYTLGTQLLNPAKKAGDLYNFFNTGDFLGRFEVEVLPNLVQIQIFSTGTGSGLKKDFFDGYNKNLFGLNTEDQNRLNYEIIYEPLMEFINRYI